jgi:hypothetical protein
MYFLLATLLQRHAVAAPRCEIATGFRKRSDFANRVQQN